MIYRKKPDELPTKMPVLDALGRCRAVLITESHKVVPFGPTQKAIRLVVNAIDGLAKFLTGDETYYHAGGSSYGSDAHKWRDSGTGR